jgi:phospholipid/cholesterol/gamma-HCH transport system ATP-binding protein
MDAENQGVVIQVRDLVVGFGEQVVLDHVSLDVRRGEILGLVGGSGSGKSVFLRTVIGLLPKREGTIQVFGLDMVASATASGVASSGGGASSSSRGRCSRR